MWLCVAGVVGHPRTPAHGSPLAGPVAIRRQLVYHQFSIANGYQIWQAVCIARIVLQSFVRFYEPLIAAPQPWQ